MAHRTLLIGDFFIEVLEDRRLLSGPAVGRDFLDGASAGSVLAAEPVAAAAAVTARVDKVLLDLIDQYAADYYDTMWQLSIDQFKAWIAAIAKAEGGIGAYTAHSQGAPGSDRFEHVASPTTFRFSTGLGPFQLDRGSTENWGTWKTIDKINPTLSVKSTMQLHSTRFGPGSTLADFSAGSAWYAVKGANVGLHWASVTGTDWAVHSTGVAPLDWQAVKAQMAANATGPSFVYADNVRDLGLRTWSVDAADGVTSSAGVAVRFEGNLRTWLITARNWSGTALFDYYYTNAGNFEAWVLANPSAATPFRYAFVRNFTLTQFPEHRSGSIAGVTLASAALDPNTVPSTQSPFHGSPFAIGSSRTVIQAEDFDNGGQNISFFDSDTANRGTKYRATAVDIQSTTDTGGGHNVGWTRAGEWLEYTINVATAGSYNLEFRVASLAAGGTFQVNVGGVNKTGTLTVPNTGGWQNWTTITKSNVTLAAGKQVLRLALNSVGASGGVANFNWLAIKPASTPITIQAENFDNGVEGVAYHDLDATNLGGKYRSTGVDIQTTTDTGGGYNIGYVKAGEWLKYTVNIASGGLFKADFRVASAGSNGKFHLEVDGIDVTGQLTLPNTGGWQNWTTVTKTGINLSSGTHVLRLRMDANGSTGSVGNFNWFKLSSV